MFCLSGSSTQNRCCSLITLSGAVLRGAVASLAMCVKFSSNVLELSFVGTSSIVWFGKISLVLVCVRVLEVFGDISLSFTCFQPPVCSFM